MLVLKIGKVLARGEAKLISKRREDYAGFER